MSLQIIQRRDYLHNWTAREAESPAKGNLRRGEIAIAIVTDDGTDNGNITEVIGRIGPSDTPTPFSDCPVVFRSPRGFKGADVRPVLVDDAPATNAVLAYDNAAGKFVTVDEDPGTYEEVDGTESGGGSEGGGVELGEIEPTILLVQSSGLATQAVVDTNPTYTLTIEVIGRPDPILSIEIEETAWPDYENNALNFSTSTSYQFSTDDLPQGVSVSVVDSVTLGELGARTYTITGLAVNRSTPTSRVAINARLGASNPAGSSPESLYATQGQIAFVADPATATPEPTLSSVTISEGGSAKSKIANLATGGTATLTASYVATGFTDGVANGTVSYQWYEGDAALVGETAPSVTITNNADRYNDSQVSVEVTIADDNGSDSRRGYIAIGDYDEGFTQLTPAADSRLVYVATDGNDAEAGNNQHGRRYYLPSDPEIGGNPQLPAQPENIKAYATISAAVVPIRGHRWKSESNNQDDYGDLWSNGNDAEPQNWPDWLLFRRGQTFPTEDYLSTIGDHEGNTLLNLLWAHGTNGQVGGSNGGYWGGRSETERAVVTAWGASDAEPRPIIEDNIVIRRTPGNIAITSLDCAGGFGFQSGTEPRSWDNGRTGTRNVLIEDCKGVGGGGNRNWWTNVVIRRCQFLDVWNPSAHNGGLFISTPDNNNRDPDQPSTWTIEECVFDRNGYKEDPNEPTTWTRSLTADLGLSGYGTGYQPKRTYYDRNMYASVYDSLTVRGNIFSRNGGGGSLQARTGGVIERNLFLWNNAAIAGGHPEAYEAYWKDTLIVDNVVAHGDHMLPPGGFDQGIALSGVDTHDIVVKGNIVTKIQSTSGNYPLIMLTAKSESNKSRAAAAKLIVAVDNDFHSDGGKEVMRIVDNNDIVSLIYRDNATWIGGQKDNNPNFSFSAFANSFWSSAQGITGQPWDISDNDYASDASAYGFRFQRLDKTDPRDLSEWQAAGFDAGSTLHADKAALSAAAGWTDPDRSILTYMQAVDPTYVVDENVYVDADTTGQKQANRVEVWKALSYEDQTDPHQQGFYTTAVAKQIAREYHAFISFIQKARANRKGAWDSRWTADAVNNYIREGFGKAPVGGAYTASITDLGAYA